MPKGNMTSMRVLPPVLLTENVMKAESAQVHTVQHKQAAQSKQI